MRMTLKRQLMIQGSVAALIPIIFFLLLALGNEGSEVHNYLRALPIVGLVVLAWLRPQIGGWALIALGFVFAILYAVNVRTEFQLLPSLAILLVFFVPIVGAGYLFLRAHKNP